MTDIALKCKDHAGRIIVFKQDSYDSHKLKHAELEDEAYFPKRVLNALKNPDFKVQGHHNNSTCYYVEEFSHHGIISYTKVVVSDIPEMINGEKVYRIKTSHKCGHIQEKRYGYDIQCYGGKQP